MIEKVIPYLNTKLEALNYATVRHGLCRKIADASGEAAPREYCAGGEFKPVELDFAQGTSYWRRLSSATITEKDADQLASCEIVMDVRERLRLVMYIPKNRLSEDDQYSEDRIVQAVMGPLITKSPALKNSLKAKSVTITPEGFIVDSAALLAEEYDNISRVDIKYQNAYIAIDFLVSVVINKNCLQGEC